MGLFGKKKEQIPQASRNPLSDALDFLDYHPSSLSDEDKTVLIRAYNSLSDSVNFYALGDDAIETVKLHDEHMRLLCRAIISQNIMLMKRLDRIQKTVEEIKASK